MKLLSRADNPPYVFSLTYRTAFNYMIVNLALGDIFYSTFLLAHFTLSRHLSNPYDITGNAICIVLRKLTWLGSYSAVFTMIVIARERYYMVVHPHDSKGKLTMQKLKVWDLNICCYFMEEKNAKGKLDVSRKSRKLFGPEKPFVKLRPTNSVELVFSYVVKGIKFKITAKFRASRRLRFEDTKRIMSREMRPKSFGTFEKQAPAPSCGHHRAQCRAVVYGGVQKSPTLLLATPC